MASESTRLASATPEPGPEREPGGASPTPPPPWRSRSLLLKAGLFLVVTTVVVGGLIAWVGAGDVLGLILSIGPGHLAVATLLTLTITVVHATRFRAVLRAIGYDISPRRAFHLTMAAWPISSITPAKAGDMVKAYYLRQQVPATATLGALLAERVVDVAAWGVLSLIGSLFFDRPAITAFSVLVLGCILAFFALAPWTTRLPLKASWRDRIDLLLRSTRALSHRPGFLLFIASLTLVNCTTTILVTFVLFDGVGASVPFLYTVAALPPAMYAGLLPLTLGGMGTRDSMLMLLFEPYATSAQALSVGILYACFFRWLLSIVGIPFLYRILKRG